MEQILPWHISCQDPASKSWALVFGIPRSASSSHTVIHQSLLTAAHTRSTFSSVWCRLARTWITFNRFSTIFEAFVPHFYLCCTHCIIPESLLSHLNSFCGGMFKLNAKFDADLLLYSLSHFECGDHRVHMPTQERLPPPLTSTVKLSLFTHVHSVHFPWLPGCTDVAQTILIILPMAGLFLDRPHIMWDDE